MDLLVYKTLTSVGLLEYILYIFSFIRHLMTANIIL